MPAPEETLRVLLVEDDEDDYILARDLFGEFTGLQVQIEWVKQFAAALQAMSQNRHDICLVDYRLGAQNGIELLRAALDAGCRSPVILLTGQGEHEIDLEAMKAGAADYLVKGRLDSGLLERSIRYALERKRGVDRAASEQARLAAFGEEIGLALTRQDALETILHRCAAAMVQYLRAGIARIWILDEATSTLKLHASVGSRSDTAFLSSRAPQPAPELELGSQPAPTLISPVAGDKRFSEQEWARRKGVQGFAAYPLLLEERTVGLMSMFSSAPLSGAVLQEMASVAHGIALCIERKRSALALDASEVKYRSVVENIKEVIFQTDREGRWTFLNPAWTQITGFPAEQSLGSCFTDYIHPEDRERHREIFQDVLEQRKSYCQDETRYLAADGTFRWMEVYAQPVVNQEAHLCGVSGTLSDITERKRAEAEIQKLAAFPRYSPDPVMELAADGTLTYVNHAAHALARQLEVDNPESILPNNAATIARECLKHGQSRLSQQLQLKGRTLNWSFFPIIPSQVVHCYGADITERLNLEAQLRHAQKLESVGQLAAGVAHDFNNILTIIQGHSDRLIERSGENVEVTEPLKQVSAAARRASSLTQQLLLFSRKQRMQPKVIDLNKVIANMTKMLQRLLGEDVTLQSRFDPGLPSIEADGGMMEQILMNLSVNARDAMPKGGKLLIETDPAHLDDEYVQQHPEARPGEFVRLTVTDTGTGMTKETLARIFEPFFTTKEVGKGTGLGLATIYGIVKQHQGWIEVQSHVGQGTTFIIHFPASTRSLDTAFERNSPRPQVKGGKETILLVEDEPVLRELARTILKDYNYKVFEASCGHEAIRVWESHPGEIDLLFTDMVMPQGMTGRELADELRRRKPDLRIVYTSGYSTDVMGGDLPVLNTFFLQKPYPPIQLAKTVRECLDF